MRKRRTRQHMVGDFGVNHIERQILLAGFVFEPSKSDYGVDGYIKTFDADGFVENTLLNVQVKSTESPDFRADSLAYVFDLSKEDLEHWLSNWLPTYLVLYDHLAERAFFIEMQAYFQENALDLRDVKKFVRVFIPTESTFEPNFIKKFRTRK